MTAPTWQRLEDGALFLRCADCGVLEVVPLDAWEAMGRPAPEDLGWQRARRLAWLCELNGCADAA